MVVELREKKLTAVVVTAAICRVVCATWEVGNYRTTGSPAGLRVTCRPQLVPSPPLHSCLSLSTGVVTPHLCLAISLSQLHSPLPPFPSAYLACLAQTQFPCGYASPPSAKLDFAGVHVAIALGEVDSRAIKLDSPVAAPRLPQPCSMRGQASLICRMLNFIP